MKKLTILCALILSLFVGASAQAQTTITNTTLSAAIAVGAGNPQAFTITVASATGMAANGILWIEGSVYRILSVSSTTITVINTAFPATHLTSAVVYVVPVAAQITVDPTGSCLRGGTGQFPLYSPYTLMFNMTNGHIASCRGGLGSRLWVITAFVIPQSSTTPPQTP